MEGATSRTGRRAAVRCSLVCGLVLALLLVDGAREVRERGRQRSKPAEVAADGRQRESVRGEDVALSNEVNIDTDDEPQEDTSTKKPLSRPDETPDEKPSSEKEHLASDAETAGETEADTSLEEEQHEVEPSAPYVENISAECLRYHNLFRVDQLDHSLPPLEGHAGMNQYVVALLQKSTEAGCRHFEMPSDTPFGANFYATSADKPTCMGATHLWYRGIDNFHGRYPGADWQRGGANQFSQMMWEHTEYLACARTRGCSRSMNQLLCLYYPAGNVMSERPFSAETWAELLERHQRWKRYDEPGGRRDRRPASRQA